MIIWWWHKTNPIGRCSGWKWIRVKWIEKKEEREKTLDEIGDGVDDSNLMRIQLQVERPKRFILFFHLEHRFLWIEMIFSRVTICIKNSQDEEDPKKIPEPNIEKHNLRYKNRTHIWWLFDCFVGLYIFVYKT